MKKWEIEEEIRFYKLLQIAIVGGAISGVVVAIAVAIIYKCIK